MDGDVGHDVSAWCVAYQRGALQGAVRGCSGNGALCVVWCGVEFTMALRLGLERKTFISLSFKR